MISRKVIAAIHARKQKTIAVSTFAIYCFCMLNVAIFGHFGGRSVFGATTPRKVETAKENQVGIDHRLEFMPRRIYLIGFFQFGIVTQRIVF